MGTDFGVLLSGQSSLAEKLRADALSEMQQIHRSPAPEARLRWAIQPRWEGIESAGLVVVNVHRADQRSAAERMVGDLVRLRRDPELCHDILGPLGSRVPITAVAADLHNPADPGLRKALARVRRVVQRRPSWGATDGRAARQEMRAQTGSRVVGPGAGWWWAAPHPLPARSGPGGWRSSRALC